MSFFDCGIKNRSSTKVRKNRCRPNQDEEITCLYNYYHFHLRINAEESKKYSCNKQHIYFLADAALFAAVSSECLKFMSFTIKHTYRKITSLHRLFGLAKGIVN